MSKNTNWSEGLVQLITAAAEASESGKLTNEGVKTLARNPEMVQAGKTIAMIRGKATSEKIYQKSDPVVRPEGEAPTRKIEYVNSITTMLGLPKHALDTLEKGSKPQLEALSQALVSLSDQREANAQ